ncbi:MAG TPA: ATP synthase subunit I [Pyrinomonadaceae bacterium]|nr:ATP synthase subunit I [Pyrinomonadaceae bacterium]
MSEVANTASRSALKAIDPVAMERRLFRMMCVTVALAVLLSAPFAPWRVTTGLLLGGLLSLFNHHWLKSSLSSVFSTAESGKRVKIGAARYVLRYFVIAAVIAAAYTLNLVSIVATLVGLCSFVVAAMLEAFMQIYFAIVNREEN